MDRADQERCQRAVDAADWVVTRKMERNVDIPADIAAARQVIIDACEVKEAVITAATTVEELIVALGYAPSEAPAPAPEPVVTPEPTPVLASTDIPALTSEQISGL